MCFGCHAATHCVYQPYLKKTNNRTEMKKYILLICLLAGILPKYHNGSFSVGLLSESYAQFYDYEDEDYYRCPYCNSHECNGGCLNNTTCCYCGSTNCDGSCMDTGCPHCGSKDCWGECQNTSSACPFCGSIYCWGNCISYGCRYCGSYSCDGSCINSCSYCGSSSCNGSCVNTPQGCPYCGSYYCSGECINQPSGGDINICLCCLHTTTTCICKKCIVCGKIIQAINTRSANTSCDICSCADDLCEEIDLFLENPGLYSIVTRGTVIPGPRPGPDYIFRLNKWVHINEIKDYSGLCYHETVKKYYFNDAEMKEYLEECIDTYSFPLGGGVVAAAAVGYVSDKLFEKLCGYFERVGSFALTCIGAFFDAHTETVEELYQDSYHKYTKTSEQGGYIIVTLVVESNGDLTSIYNMFEVFDAQGLPVDRFLY